MIKLSTLLLLILYCIGCQLNPDLGNQESFRKYEVAEVGGEVIRAHPKVVSYQPENILQVSMETLHQGERLYKIHCAQCHGARAEGKGLIDQHGFSVSAPDLYSGKRPSWSIEDIYKVLNQGQGRMLAVNHKLTSDEMTSVSHFVKVLQEAHKRGRP